MSSIYIDKGPENMYDNKKSTMAHTLDNEPGSTITVDLFIPERIHSVIFMNRDHADDQLLTRLNNTKVTLVSTDDEAIICGYTAVIQVVASGGCIRWLHQVVASGGCIRWLHQRSYKLDARTPASRQNKF